METEEYYGGLYPEAPEDMFLPYDEEPSDDEEDILETYDSVMEDYYMEMYYDNKED